MWGKKACCAVRVVPSGFCPNASRTPLTAGETSLEATPKTAEPVRLTANGSCGAWPVGNDGRSVSPAVSGVAGGAA